MKASYVLGYAPTIYDIDPCYLESLGIHVLISVLDQTLASAFDQKPEPRVLALRDELLAHHIQLMIVSNNMPKRVQPFCEAVGVPYLPFAFKFVGFRVRKWLKKLSLRVEDCVFVGDQLMTDGIYVRKLHGKLILTDPLVPKDNWQTKLLRRADNKKRQRLLAHGKLGIKIPTRKS
jgi:HAD superfamily phosphatase (TIGR01668 family)